MHNQDSFTPSYMKIQNYIWEKIESGEYGLGDQIPSETELAAMFSVSRVTANKAIKEMSLMGILERVRGRGTFVRANQNVSTASKAFVSAVKLDVTGNRQHQLLQFRVLDSFPELAEKSGLPEEAPFYEIILVNKNQEQWESLDYTYIPCSLIENIAPSLDYFRTHFVFDYLKSQPGLNPKFLKIFVNTPPCPFLESAYELLGKPDSIQIWSTDVYDANMKLLSTTFTTYPSSARDIPLFTFSL